MQPFASAALVLAWFGATAALGVTTCINSSGVPAPCGPGNDDCDATKPHSPAPAFHVQDLSCAENDPNAPCYNPAHGVYHLMYQKHCGLASSGGGPVFGHVVSHDLVHWARLPVAVWNDRPYDSRAIFSGSCVNDGGLHSGAAAVPPQTALALRRPEPLSVLEKYVVDTATRYNSVVESGWWQSQCYMV